MRFSRLAVAGLALALVLTTMGAGCDDNPTTSNPEDLAPPLGLTSVTGNGAVTLRWQASNYGEDREGFYVYQASGTQGSTPGESIPAAFGTAAVATVTTSQGAGAFNTTVTGLTNGTTYSFLVVAFKDGGDNLSRPSNVVSDTPRRESTALDLTNGTGNVRYVNLDADPPSASSSSTGADILCQSFNAGAGDRPGMVGQNGARIQDLGFVSTWDEIDKAPAGAGSYPDASHSVEVLRNHVYAVFTGDNHYGKIWVTDLHAGDFGYSCRAAYQPQAGSNELKPGGRDQLR
jgi:hypothetical protein